ncbi:MAG: hypothetical protein LQ339_005168 [Xanthoria mediterranea]|nr:MAG: hypothetical protein LQ339_005168 [Xanthoria mediterranea]
MLAFLLATKALALWAAASGFLGYTLLVNDGPVRAVQAFAKLGLQRTLESRKLLVHSAPVSRTLHGAPLFPMAPSVNVPGAPINESLDSFLVSMASGSHTTEPSYHSSTSASTHAPTKTHNSPRYLPVLGPSKNAAPRATLAEQARTLQPQPSLGNQLPSALLPHDLFTSIVALPTELSFKAQLCLVFGGLALGLGICAFWRISVARVEATARLDRKYWASFVNALAKDGDLQARLRSLKHLSREIAVEAACSGTPKPLVLTSILDGTIEDLKKQQLKIDLGEIVLPEGELKREILSLQTTVSEITDDKDQLMKDSEDLQSKYRDALTENSTLSEAKKTLEAQNNHLSKANQDLEDRKCDLNIALDSTRFSMGQRIDGLRKNVQELTHEVEKAKATREDLDEKCQGLVSENRELEQVNGDLDCQLQASKTKCSDLAEELTDYKAQNQRLAHASQVTKAKKDQAGEKLSNLKKTCDFNAETAEKYRMDAKRSDKGLLDSQLEVQRMVEEKKAKAKELKTTQEENAALAAKVTELMTTSPSSSHHAPSMNDTLRLCISLISQCRC